MSARATSHIPDGYGTVTPFVIVKGAVGFIEYMVRAFDGTELGRVGEEGAIGHAEVRIGDSVVMLFDSKPGWPDTPAFLRLYVEDVDATYRRAIDAGGTSVTEPTDMLWGDRVGSRARPVRQPLVAHDPRRGRRSRRAGTSLVRPGLAGAARGRRERRVLP